MFENKKITKITYNVKLQYKILQQYNIKLSDNTHDILLENYVLKGLIKINHCIEQIHQELMLYEHFLLKTNKKHLGNFKINIKDTSHCIFQTHQENKKYFKKEIKLHSILYDIEKPITKILYIMENNGVLLNKEKLKIQSHNIQNKLKILKNNAYKLANEKFNILSNEQTRIILFNKLKYKTITKTPTGKNSINEAVLQRLSEKYILPKIILEYRKLYKLKSNYLDKLITMINKKTGRIHTSYHQHSTTTGRLTSFYPNLQNIPKKTLEAEKIREAFIAPHDHVIVTVDYSQIELRILAHFSKDQNLIKSFRKNIDVHNATASNIFNIEIHQVTIQQRQIAKTINFSLIYGITPFGLSKKLNITIYQAKQYIHMYFEKYHGILNFIQKTLDYTSKKGYVKTLFGRKIYIPNINSKNSNIRKAAERACINAPMQGTTADIIKKAMIKIHKYLYLNKFEQGKMIIQVHDELIFEIKTQHIKTTTNNIRTIMENITTLDIPLLVHIGIGKNWNEANNTQIV
ncbi:hypothetical protein D9V80_01675 [Buchnera aphidicola (Thelaxes californica)]|uniref:DNA polymerase I n=1 Tax=Buchnera aphidicola (Thelaxes californica) TaxID=1315998 RepID=A0A4D6YAK0_9GAMM|nr:DNA polymerase [Buchnera aphidicola]QCI26857.1 hypothetical protein D9V80_01675 [Buchnera aphidicola (Thelaxes californica)]